MTQPTISSRAKAFQGVTRLDEAITPIGRATGALVSQQSMNNSDFPNVTEDFFDFLTHPQHWAGTEVHLRLKDTPEATSVLHYSPLVNKFLWRPTNDKYCVTKTRIGHDDLCTDLVKEGWVLNA
jgi:hypothetical protein